MSAATSTKTKVVIDDYTRRLLHIFTELVTIPAIHRKKDFTDAIAIPTSNFNLIERNERNYPDDSDKRKLANANLLDKYGVNPEYMKGNSTKEFLRKPQPIEQADMKEAVTHNFRNREEKLSLIAERDRYKKMYEELEVKYNQVQEELATYKINADNKTDKLE